MTYFNLNPARKETTTVFDVMDNFLGKDLFDLSSVHRSIAPMVNVKEIDEAFLLEVVAPGLKKEDLKVEVEKNQLVVSYTNTEEEKETTDKFIRKEFGYRSFKRSFTLPDTANTEDITANYENGILMLQIAKKEAEKPKLITIA